MTSSAADLSIDKGYYHASDTVTRERQRLRRERRHHGRDLRSRGRCGDPHGRAPRSDGSGSFSASFVADPDGKLGDRVVSASDGESSAGDAYQVVRDDDPTVDPPTGDILRLYRTALITDPGYSTYHGGPANVTPAKVALMNRVSQVYEDDLSITLQLIAQTDLLNLNTWADATAPNGPCGAAACFAQANVTGCSALARNRVVAGQIVGSENFELGHLALGQPGGGVASLGVVGRADEVAGLHGHPDSDRRLLCHRLRSPRNGPSVQREPPVQREPAELLGRKPQPGDLGRARLRLLRHGLRGHLLDRRPLSPTATRTSRSARLQEISTYTASNQAAINEVQSAALRHFGGGNEVQVATFGPGYQPTNAIQPLTVAIGAAPNGTTQLGGLSQSGTTVTVSTGAAGATHTLQPGDSITISGAGDPGYNGTFTVDAVLTSRAFTVTNPTPGLTEVRRRDDHAERARPHRGRHHRDRPHDARAQPLGRRPGLDQRSRQSPATTSRPR